ncbi:Ig-like domain-containing protein [Clostridium cadaveris]|uniref:Ig-like domain-containing protein n=1 Tax=Clostridium cadaveris TaxID=1529 RepID=UPI000C069530|nr:Ig-like domain-containing protein [Clostridium cadaveris]
MLNPMETVYENYKKKYGINATIDNKDTRLFYIEKKDALDGIDYKEVYADKKLINQGSIIKMDNITYLVVEKTYNYKNTIYDTGIIEPCQIIKLKNNNIDCVVENLKADITTGNIIAFVDNKLLITLNTNNVIEINDQIEYKNLIYKIIAKDITKEGLIICKADYVSVAVSYTIELTQKRVTVEQDNTYQIQATVKNNTTGTNVDNPTINYKSENDTIAKVDNKGLVTGIGVGSTTITLTYENASAIFNIEVTEKPPKPVATRNVEIIGKAKINKNAEETYTLKNLDTQETITEGNYVFKLDEYAESESLGTIVSQTGHSCVLKGLVQREQLLLEVWLDNTKIEGKDLTISIM